MKKIEYKDIINELSTKFKVNIPNNEEKLVYEFENYLYTVIEVIENSNSDFINKDRKSIEKSLRIKTEELINCNLDYIKQVILMDKNFEELKQISNKAFLDAINVLKGETIEYDIDKKISRLESLLDLVESYNIERAKDLVSEGILDLYFINDPEPKVCSLRLAHLIKSQQDNKLKEKEEER